MHPCIKDRIAPAEVMPLAWYVAYTRHQHEKAAANHLAGKQIDVLLPLYRSLSRWKDRNKEVQLPLFPGYLFIRASIEQRLDVLRAPGVCWLVGTAGVPTAIPQHEVESIRRLVESPLPFGPHPFPRSGDRVRVRSGPLAGLEGILTRFKGQDRVVLAVNLLRQAAAVEIDVALLERIAPSPSYGPARLIQARQCL